MNLAPMSEVAPQGPLAHAPQLVATLREYVVRYRGELDARIARGEPALVVGKQWSRAVDGLLSALLPATAATLAKSHAWIDCTLAAVGTYGRGVLAPRSDLDVRLIVDRNANKIQEVAEAILYPLWDAGCPVQHQVFDVEGALQLAREDLTTATALLDLRVVAGDRARVERLVERALAGYFTAELGAFVERLREERRARHERFGGSLYLLEPEVKSGAGGLRDLDLARWAARARYGVRELDELVRLGVLLPRDIEELDAAQKFLWSVRAKLHLRMGRRSDRLTFDAQEELGRAMGDARSDEPDAVAAERLMQRYYGHARDVCRLVDRVLDLCDPPRPRRFSAPIETIAKGVRLFNGHATLEAPAQLASEPALAMRLYAVAHKRGLPVYPYARDAIARASSDPAWAEALRASPEASSAFLECLASAADRTINGKTGGSILRELHDVGLLLAMIPEFAPVVGRVHHDTYHVYTVDVHSVAAVDRLRALARGELVREQPLGCRIAGDVSRPLPLYVATLLHDVGKGAGGAGHSERGAEMSKPISARLGLGDEDAAMVSWLIAEHLTMYHLATRRDLDDPATVSDFAKTLVDGGGSPIERLVHLYLLTVADISTTSPTAMTSWKARMLDDLFLATSHHLATVSRGEETADKVVLRVREEAIAAHGGEDELVRSYLDGMPKSYFLSHSGRAIAAHMKLARARGGAPALVGTAPPRHEGALDLVVLADDRPGLLAKVAATLAAHRLDVLQAQIFLRPLPTRAGEPSAEEAVDFFSVRRAGRDGADAVEPLTEQEIERITRDLGALIVGESDPVTLLRSRRGGSLKERPAPAVETEVEIDDRASRRFTVIDVYGKDRPGLLFVVARALHDLGLSIARSKIATEGARAADSFYVTELGGGKVRDTARAQQISRELTAAIERLAKEGIV
jgi:[protein-PII] uridylyltransferase